MAKETGATEGWARFNVMLAAIGLEAVARLDGLVKDAVARGARILAGGHANGTLMDATVLDHVTPAMRIYGRNRLARSYPSCG